ncbi:TPA: hypothetical protein ACQSRC_004423 [Pseudomonas aeruginosa]|uniref:hypothetical protein n=1 Tax=Pseudomonas aeruginosa TaxID=287 RepID=UPI000F61F328|nr:hypothetical protein [Pseudomonas aeruginosa]RRH85252.1 hypothetical protein EIM22_02835 [Pseudomonas aeruginosa]HBO2944451.1 hypothetical protein [Pseudomonas aeruginosa]HEJ4597499.1 hypothetical protein [Pseudomonas aeruginosa]
MSRLLALLGIGLTIAYAVFIYLIFGNPIPALKEMELNSVGDFLAGVFGPVAILWLVLGFFQQGLELRQNNEALKMQADELRNSVEQQTAMAKSQALVLMHNERASEPLLVLSAGEDLYDPEDDEHFRPLRLTNTGEYCERLDVSVEGQNHVWSFATLLSGESVSFSASLVGHPIDRRLAVSVRYITKLGLPGVQEFTYIEFSRDGGGAYVQKRAFITPHSM